jgi:DNA-binding LacI/PurR family transcriptional regulator
VLNCPNPSGAVSHISTDGADGIRQAVCHLAEVHGRRRIAFVARDVNSRLMENRYAGYLCGLQQCGLEFDPRRVCCHCGDATYEKNAAMAVQRLIDGGVEVDAVICPSDYLAVAVIGELADRKRRVPRDVSVVGFDDHPICTSVRPRLTTIRCDGVEMGRRAARMMLEALDDGPIRSDVLPTSLVVRQSCGCR